MKTIIKLPFKIVALAFVPTLFLLSVAMKFFGWIASGIFAFLSLLFAVGGAVILFQGNAYGGIGIIVIAFLISPFGIPLFAEAIGEMFDGLNGSIIGFIAG